MSVPKTLLGLIERALSYFERRRGLSVVLVAAVFLGLSTTTALVSRPPLLTPTVDGIAGGFMSLFSTPLRVARFFSGPRGGTSRIMQLELELASLRRAQRENQRLRAMIGYKPPPGYDVVCGHMIGLDLDPLRGVAWLDVGSDAGLRGGEAVLTVDGLVGVLDEVWSGRSRARLLRNEFTPVSVRDTRSRRLGIVEWSPGAGGFRVSQVPYQADMAVGDTLVSSGLGGVFPPDLPVGTVTEVHEPPEKLLKEVVVEPFGAFFRLEEVFVLIPWPGPVLTDIEPPPTVADSLPGGPGKAGP